MKILVLFLTVMMMVGVVGAFYHNADAEVSVDANAQASANSDNSNQAQANAEGQVRTKIKGITVRGVSVNASDDLNITVENSAGSTKFKVKLSNGRDAEIKIMPNTASETALARLRLNVCSEENNCTIVLKETGRGDDVRVSYEMKAEKKMKVLGLFRAKANVVANVDAETGEVISVKRPWWAFLATDASASA